jgi:hypothetical protein
MCCWGLVVRACRCGREGSRGEVLGDGGGAMESSPVARGKAGGRRGRRSHVNLQFSCSFFLQGEGTPNGRLRERAGRLDVLDEEWEALDSAMRGNCDRRWRLLGDRCPERGS